MSDICKLLEQVSSGLVVNFTDSKSVSS